MYALGNIIQNAVHYSKQNTVEIEYLINDVSLKYRMMELVFLKIFLIKLENPTFLKIKKVWVWVYL